MLDPFQIHEPRSVLEASQLLAEYGDEAAVYAGGTELLVIMKERLVHYPHLVNIKTIPGLNQIGATDDELIIGALATHKAIEQSPLVLAHAPLLAQLEALVANLRVRSTGTLGGNLCFAEPHSDPATLLIAWNASITLVSAAGTRHTPLDRFFTGLLETARRPDEIATEIRIPLPVPHASAYERFKIHERPTATVAVALRMNGALVANARIVVGSVGARPQRMTAAEELLIGEQPKAAIRAEAALLVRDAVEPTEDGFESSDYKRRLAHVLTARALAAAAQRATEGRPHA